MADVVNNALLDLIANFVLGESDAARVLKLRLFVNNVTITDATLLSALTECTAPGYAPITLTYATWTGSTTGGVSNYNYPQQTISLTGPGSPGQTIYGHYVTEETSGTLAFGLTWPAAFVIPVGGGQVKITPNWTDQNC